MADTTIRVPSEVRDLLAARAAAAGTSIGDLVGRFARTAPMTDSEIEAHHERLERTLGWRKAAPDPAFADRLQAAFEASADGGTAEL